MCPRACNAVSFETVSKSNRDKRNKVQTVSVELNFIIVLPQALLTVPTRGAHQRLGWRDFALLCMRFFQISLDIVTVTLGKIISFRVYSKKKKKQTSKMYVLLLTVSIN